MAFLLERLSDRNDQVKMWAAYQLVDRWEREAEQFLEHMWNASLPEIRESAIHLIAKYRFHQYAFPLLRIFNSGEGGLRAAAGLALGHLAYQPAGRPLEQWVRREFNSPEANLPELEAGVESLLLLDNRSYWGEYHALLHECLQNHSLFSILFKTLALHAETPEQVERIARTYKTAREVFHDFYLCHSMVEMVGRPNLSRFLQSRLNGRYSLPAAYQEALQVLGVDVSDPELRNLLDGLARCTRSQHGLEQFLPIAGELIDRLAPDAPNAPLVKAFLKGCAGWVKCWDEAVLKVREVEYHLLLSLPLVAVIGQAEQECLADPAGEAMRIIRIYQSPLLSHPFMVRVLDLLSSREGEPVVAELRGGPLSGWLRDEEKDALWKLMTRQLEGVDYPFEQILPEPWQYRNPVILEHLVEVLRERFPQYLASGRGQAVDYCLEVFRRDGCQDLLHLLLDRFDTLINRHYHGFLEVMTHLPDERFLPLLLRHHREGEFEIERLIRFICDVHHKPLPQVLQRAPEKQPQGKLPATVRLMCLSCSLAYQYPLDVLYVDEERIEQRQIPTPQDLWTPHPPACKNCGAEVPLEPEPAFLGDLFTELLAARILHGNHQEQPGLSHIRLIPFPVLHGKTCPPAAFLQKVEEVLSTSRDPEEATPYLLERGKFYLEIGDLESARQSFLNAQAGPVKSVLALYYLGIIAFQEKNPYDARVYFSRLVSSASREEFASELDNPVDMAQHYLKLLEKRDFKRSHFRIISS
jgi:hypothetical protein